MEQKTLSYKDYVGSLEVSVEDNCLFGRILFIDDLVTYEGQTVEELRAAFHESVDEYLRRCAELGLKPDEPNQRRAALAAGKA